LGRGELLVGDRALGVELAQLLQLGDQVAPAGRCGLLRRGWRLGVLLLGVLRWWLGVLLLFVLLLLRRVLLRPASLLPALDVAGDVRRGARDDGGACRHTQQSHGGQLPFAAAASMAAATASAGMRAWSTTRAPACCIAVTKRAAQVFSQTISAAELFGLRSAP